MNQEIDLTFAALSDATRRAIVDQLAAGPVRMSDLSVRHRMSQQAVSKHVAVLRRAGLIKQRRRGRERWCEIQPRRLEEARSWLDRHRRLWEARLDALEQLLDGGKAPKG